MEKKPESAGILRFQPENRLRDSEICLRDLTSCGLKSLIGLRINVSGSDLKSNKSVIFMFRRKIFC